MGSNIYTQQQLDLNGQINLLKSQGLVFGDEAKARHLLSNISLFRLKNYMQPLRLKGSKDFKSGATFEQAYSLYKFDAELRKLLCPELEKIEISIRTQLSLIMSDMAGEYWFADASNFRNAVKHQSTLDTLQKELSRSDEVEIVKFYSRYSNAYPPSWMTMEVSSFGTLSMLYKWLNGGHGRRQLAAYYGISDTVMESWLHSLVYVRNVCAHHGRLWNRSLRIKPLLPKRTHMPFINTNAPTDRIFFVLCIVRYFLNTVNPHTTINARLKGLLSRYPNVNPHSMGFPQGWEKEPLWK